MPQSNKAKPIITLTSDFGGGSPYVAAMKGAILSVDPEASIIDLSHDILPQDIRQGALQLASASSSFPPGTIHVVVIDPGVGTERCLIYALIGGHRYLAPDNGVLDGLARDCDPDKIIVLTNPQYWRATISPTFHGRDILAPVAAHLSLGVCADQLGDPLPKLVQLEWPEVCVLADRIEGAIESIDSFGNLITNITEEMLGDTPRDEQVKIACDEHETRGIFRVYGDQPAMTLLALVGSGGKLELAIVADSAATMLGLKVGAEVVVSW
jgi:S-adenosylmethionine hydrolase